MSSRSRARALTGSRSRAARKRCRRKLPISAVDWMSPTSSDASGKSGLFDLALANELYKTLLGPVEALVKDKRSLLIVPSGALTALPFHLLVTEKPAAAIPEKFDGYREAAWLLKRHAVSVLPSVASLKSLRAFARKDHGIKPMTGFGDPLFDPSQAGRRQACRGQVRGAQVWRPAPIPISGAAPASIGPARASLAATAGYRRRTECGGEKPRRCRCRYSPRQRRQRDHA